MDSGDGVHIAAGSAAPQPTTPRVRRMQITALTLLVISGAVNMSIAPRWRSATR